MIQCIYIYIYNTIYIYTIIHSPMYIGYNDKCENIINYMIWVCTKILDLPHIDGKLDAENDDKTCVRKNQILLS